MHRLTTFFLYAFLLDGLFSTVDALGRLHATDVPPNDIGVCFSIAVLFLGLALFAGTVFTPRLSKRLILPPVLFMGFCIIWAVLYGDQGILYISIAEILLGAGLIIGFTDGSGGLQRFTASRPLFTWKNLLFAGLANGGILLCIAVFVALGLTQQIRCKIEESTGRFLTIQPSGISLEEKRFQHGDKEIRLISMMHVAKGGFYDDVARSLPPNASAVVLLEGVSDRGHLLKGKLDYGNIAQALGFASQKESSFTKQALEGLEETQEAKATGEKPPNLEYQVADLDLADFNPNTVEFIQAAGKLLSSSNLNDAFQKYPSLKPALEQGQDSVYADILDKRNNHLLDEVQKALATHNTIIVPWGARHMPDLQEKIKAWGFVETRHAQHQAVFFKNKALVALVSLLDWLPGDAK